MPDLYREFVLSDERTTGALWNFLKANASAFAQRGHPLRVVVSDEDQDRLEEQIRYYFGVVIAALSENAWVGGGRFSKEAWHEEMARQFLPQTEITLPGGEIIQRRQSIARGHIGIRAMAEFTQKVEAHAATEYGIEFEPRKLAA